MTERFRVLLALIESFPEEHQTTLIRSLKAWLKERRGMLH